MSQEDFNKLLQDKFDSREFEVSEEKWNTLLPEIEKQEKKRKRRILFYFLIPGLLFLVSLPFLFNHEEKDQVANKPEVNERTYTKEPNTGTINTGEQKNNTQPNESSEVHEQSPIDTTPSNASANRIEKTTSENPSSSLKQKDPAETSKDPSLKFSNKGKSEITLKSTTGKKQETDVPDKDPVDKGSEAIVTNTLTKEKTPAPEPETVRPNNLEQQPVLTVTNSVDSLKKQDSVSVVVTKTDSLPASVKDSIAAKKDSIDKNNRELEIFSAAYIAFTPGYVGTPSFYNATNPGAGIGIRKFFTNTIGMGTGLYYNIYSNIMSDPRVFKNTTHDFGYESNITEIQTKRLHYLKLPLTLEVKLNKNIFSLGAEFMYLITSSSNVSLYTQSYESQSGYESKKEYGYVSGFSNYDIGAVFIYSRKLTRRIAVNALLNMGFIDVKQNDYFNSNTFDRNKSLQLGVSYKLN